MANQLDKSSVRRRGFLLVVSSPSGVGKSTLCAMLMQEYGLALSISATTRAPRSNEQDGVHYHFLSMEEFLKKRDAGEFLEWAEVHGHYYGTLRQYVEAALAAGQDLLVDIDYQGAEALAAQLGSDMVSVFIFPPSLKELRNRLEKRGENSLASMNLRLRNARNELAHWRSYDYAVINHIIEDAFKELSAIYKAETLKRARAYHLKALLDSLMDEPV